MKGFGVLSIQPGSIATPIWDKSVAKADEFLNNFPAKADQLYGSKLTVVRKRLIATGRRGIEPEEVAKVVVRALTARRPKTRYLVGQDAKMGALLVKLLPDRLRDWLITRGWRFMGEIRCL